MIRSIDNLLFCVALGATLALTACDSNSAANHDGADDDGGDSGNGSGGGHSANVPKAWAACEHDYDCVVRAASCCGTCGDQNSDGIPEPSANDIVAVHKDHASDFGDEACDGMPISQCGACAQSSIDPFLFGTCDDGTCKVVNLHTLPATECEKDEDCMIRTSECCGCYPEGSNSNTLIAVSGDIESLTCDDEVGQEACKCANGEPAAEAKCGADNRCTVVNVP